jgi:hypothetical protein
MATIAAESNLLFGLLALQNGLIDQDQLVAAFRGWTRGRWPNTLPLAATSTPSSAPAWRPWSGCT